MRILILFFLILPYFVASQERCRDQISKLFSYESNNSEKAVFVCIKKRIQIEYHEKGKYYIKSKIRWIDDCTYELTMKKITIPNFPNSIGDKMIVKINEIRENGDLIYTCQVGSNSWNSVMKKIDKLPEGIN